MKHVEFYRNDADGKVLVVVGAQAPEEVIYAGQKLTHLVAGSVDAAQENTSPVSRKSTTIWKFRLVLSFIRWKKNIILNGLPWSTIKA